MKTAVGDMVPLVLPEILLLAEDSKPDAPSIFANSLWYKYRTSPDWGWKVWDNTMASLRQVPLMADDVSKRHMIALQYAQFLLHVDRHLPAGIDEQVLRWFLGTGKGEILVLTVEAWDVLSTPHGLSWQRSCLNKRNYCVSIEHNPFVPQYLRDMASDLRVRTCESRQFRFAAYRDLDVIRRAFEQPIQSGSIDETLYEPLLNALKVILSDLSEDLQAQIPWRLAATAVQLQFGLRQLGRAMVNDSTKQAASASLDKMTSVLFHHSIASDEACFIAEMVKEIDSSVAGKVHLFTTLDEPLIYQLPSQFVSNGMESLVEILACPSTPLLPEILAERIDRAGEILRLLSHLMEPFRMKGSVLQLDASCQERLGKGICEILSAVESMFATTGAEESKRLT
ncbi:hypothetical protein J3R83DRAFT_13457 [Lanmaoa asiatica]|nr:hypothetical protein J3R83DRAFT_13457 [Lanmaoa asiatica]